MKARHYDPVIGRFYSKDSVGFTSSNTVMFNRYAYVNNNPYRYIDPEGLTGEKTDMFFSDNDPEDEEGVDNDNSEFLEDSLFDLSPFSNDNGVYSLGLGPMPQLLGSPKSTSVPAPTGADTGVDFFRGAKSGNAPDFTPRPNDFKVDKVSSKVKSAHGVSVFDNIADVEKNGYVLHKLNQSTVPDSLQIIQRGNNPGHFEITPKPGANLTPQQFF